MAVVVVPPSGSIMITNYPRPRAGGCVTKIPAHQLLRTQTRTPRCDAHATLTSPTSTPPSAPVVRHKAQEPPGECKYAIRHPARPTNGATQWNTPRGSSEDKEGKGWQPNNHLSCREYMEDAPVDATSSKGDRRTIRERACSTIIRGLLDT